MMRFWNFLGVPVTWFYLNILKKQVNESIRKKKGDLFKGVCLYSFICGFPYARTG